MEPIVLETLTDLYGFAPQTITGVDFAGLQFSSAMRCSIYTTFGFIPSRSNTVSAVTKVPPWEGRRYSLAFEILRLRIDFDATTCTSSFRAWSHRELFLDVLGEALSLEIVERVGPQRSRGRRPEETEYR